MSTVSVVLLRLRPLSQLHRGAGAQGPHDALRGHDNSPPRAPPIQLGPVICFVHGLCPSG